MDTADPRGEEYIKITAIEDPIEAQLISSVLTERDIPHQVYSFHDTAFNGLFQTQKGWGKLMAPPAFRDLILEIVEDIRSNPASSGEFE